MVTRCYRQTGRSILCRYQWNLNEFTICGTSWWNRNACVAGLYTGKKKNVTKETFAPSFGKTARPGSRSQVTKIWEWSAYATKQPINQPYCTPKRVALSWCLSDWDLIHTTVRIQAKEKNFLYGCFPSWPSLQWFVPWPLLMVEE